MIRWSYIGAATTIGLLLTASPAAAQRLMSIDTRSGQPYQRWNPDPMLPDLPKPPTAMDEGQRPVDTSKLHEFELAQPLELPTDDAEAALLAYVRNTPASNLDAGLPQLELDSWLTATLLPYNANAAPVEWRLDQCEDLTSDIPWYAAELCTEATVPVSGEKTLTLILAVGDWREASDGRSGWVVHPPAIRDLFIQTAANSLDIQSLSELTTAFNLPVDRWPTVEFELAVDASPLRALPGEIVTFRVQVRNTGKRNAQRAEVTLGVSIGDTPDEAKSYDYQWFPAIPAGRTVALELPIGLPKGRGVFHASVNAFSSRKRFKERDTSRNSMFLWVHQATDPPELPATVR
jgi:uncharacterized repeat protein (TIGR01451 family)